MFHKLFEPFRSGRNLHGRVGVTMTIGPVRTAIMALVMLTSCVTDGPEHALAPGDPVPQLTVTLNDGTVFSTSSRQVSMVVLFNTSCEDCRQELPIIQCVYDYLTDCEQARAGRPALVCISREEDEASIEAYWKNNGFTMPYSAQTDRTVYELFASSGIPRIYLINTNGIITDAYGPDDRPDAYSLIARLKSVMSNSPY